MFTPSYISFHSRKVKSVFGGTSASVFWISQRFVTGGRASGWCWPYAHWLGLVSSGSVGTGAAPRSCCGFDSPTAASAAGGHAGCWRLSSRSAVVGSTRSSIRSWRVVWSCLGLGRTSCFWRGCSRQLERAWFPTWLWTRRWPRYGKMSIQLRRLTTFLILGVKLLFTALSFKLQGGF